MRSSRFVSLAAGAALMFSTITAGAGICVAPVTVKNTGHSNPTFVWIIFGCAGSIIFTAYVKHLQQHQQLTPIEAQTCGLAYWFTARNHP